MAELPAVVVTAENVSAIIAEYNALSFSMAHRKLSAAEAARHLALEEALMSVREG